MPGMRYNVKTKYKGSIFNAAKSKAAALRAITEVNEVLAQEAVNRIKVRLGQVLKNPSGFYESRIAVNRGQRYRGAWDNRVAYGGWLEGVDPRNSGRFKGYRTFRLVRQTIDKDHDRLVQPVVTRLVRELNGQ